MLRKLRNAWSNEIVNILNIRDGTFEIKTYQYLTGNTLEWYGIVVSSHSWNWSLHFPFLAKFDPSGSRTFWHCCHKNCQLLADKAQCLRHI